MQKARSILVTGGAGFIGCNLVRRLLGRSAECLAEVVNLDSLTYAGSEANLRGLEDNRHYFVRGSVCDAALVAEMLRRHRIDAVLHLAAESHVDRSIDGPAPFVQTNILGTHTLLDVALAYWKGLSASARDRFRFVQVSTDEVFGSLEPDGEAFHESTPYAPRNPYAATKAAGDHLARSYGHTYGLPVIVTNSSNNYGPRQHPEKLIPLILLNALDGLELPLYGDGLQVRDWLFVEDHCVGLERVLEVGLSGESYHFGGDCQITNLELVETLCVLLDELRPRTDGRSHAEQIRFVADRPGHDNRYAMDIRKAQRELGWIPQVALAEGLRETVQWYLSNRHWCEAAGVSAGTRRRQGLATC